MCILLTCIPIACDNVHRNSVEALTRLHNKTRALDNLLDDRAEGTTLRRAWREVRDNLEREADSRSAFLGCLKSDVLPPLSTLKETQERTRKQIKENLKASTTAHNEYVEGALPRARRNYWKKCHEVEVSLSAPCLAGYVAAILTRSLDVMPTNVFLSRPFPIGLQVSRT